jgi:hypothetical protein
MDAPDTSGAEPQSVLGQEAARRAAALRDDAQPGRSPAGERQGITNYMARVVEKPKKPKEVSLSYLESVNDKPT